MKVQLDENRQWLSNVPHVASPNFDARPGGCDIDLLLIHGISLPPGEFATSCIEQLFCNALNYDAHPYFRQIRELRVSAHLLIDRQGGIMQFVPFHKRAWHAGQSVFNGRENCNDFSIGIELVGTDDTAYEGVQYEALVAAIMALQRVWPQLTTENIRGHCDVAPGRKTDPGPAFDWDRLHTMLGAFPLSR